MLIIYYKLTFLSIKFLYLIFSQTEMAVSGKKNAASYSAILKEIYGSSAGIEKEENLRQEVFP